jgi:hypothetical protein
MFKEELARVALEVVGAGNVHANGMSGCGCRQSMFSTDEAAPFGAVPIMAASYSERQALLADMLGYTQLVFNAIVLWRGA